MAEDTTKGTLEQEQLEQEENSTFNFQTIYKTVVLNW